MKDKMIGVDSIDLYEINRIYAPFSHATTRESAKQIDKQGLRPRKETSMKSTYAGPFESMEDRIYFASARDFGYKSLNALISIFGDEKSDAKKILSGGVIYVLKEIPDDFADFVVIDEDCIDDADEANRNKSEDEDEVTCESAIDSLRLTGSLALTCPIPRNLLVKMSVDRFCNVFKHCLSTLLY